MYRKGIRYLGAVALVAAAAGSAEAGCNDYPRPGVDWQWLLQEQPDNGGL